MVPRLARIFATIALCSAIGLQWVALQSVAWTGMLISYSKHSSLRQAIAQTFDGAHPCALCHAVNKGKASEKKSNVPSVTTKIDLICPLTFGRLVPPVVQISYLMTVSSLLEVANSPPFPPPRIG